MTNGNPEIYLEDAQISVTDGNAIDITGGTPTIHVRGDDNEVSSSDGAGIYVAQGSTVDFLSAGIGGSGNNGCGTITIDNATISAYGASDGAAGNMSSPGIGGGLYGDDKGTYSTITIKNNSQVSVQRGSNRSDYIGSGGSTNNPANSPNGIDATVDETSTITPLN